MPLPYGYGSYNTGGFLERVKFCTARSRRSCGSLTGVCVVCDMDCYVYIIGSGDRTYCGWTTDLDKRLKAHNDGTWAKSTRGRQWRLLYAERYQTRSEAMSREWYVKRDRKLRRLVSGGWYAPGTI